MNSLTIPTLINIQCDSCKTVTLHQINTTDDTIECIVSGNVKKLYEWYIDYSQKHGSIFEIESYLQEKYG